MRHEPASPRPGKADGRQIRIDMKAKPDAQASEDRGTLMELFRAWVATRNQDRRHMPRHAPREFGIWLGWWRGDREFFAVTAKLINISRGGALLSVVGPPPENHGVWVCLGASEPTECVAGRVLEVTTLSRRECALRVVFDEPCPPGFFQSAVCGLANGTRGTVPPPGFAGNGFDPASRLKFS